MHYFALIFLKKKTTNSDDTNDSDRFRHDRVSRTRTSPQLVALLRQSFSVTNCLYKNKRNKRKAEALHTASGKTLTTKFPQPAQMLTPGTTT